jgi:ubiquitin-activating enzyme E1
MQWIYVLRLFARLAPLLVVVRILIEGADAGGTATFPPQFPPSASRRGSAGLFREVRALRKSSWVAQTTRPAFVVPRGGGGGAAKSDETKDETVHAVATTSTALHGDEERYSRQVYTLGARAHKLIRSSTVYLDGPATSGLVYETAKNLALSGVGRIVLVVPNEENDDENAPDEQVFHNQDLDDLGAAYTRAARAELGETEDDVDPVKLLVGYIQRLNPSITVTTLAGRDQIRYEAAENDEESKNERRKVVLALDRPFSTQVQLNELSRETSMAFVAVETFGVYGRAFCDFGPSFKVYDADGETPAVTPLLRLDLVEDGEHTPAEGKLMVFAVEGEKHDVSKGDVVQFQLRDGTYLDGNDLVVSDVIGPFQFSATVRRADGAPQTATDVLVACSNLEAVAFRRVKVPQIVAFEPLERAASGALTDSSVFTPCDLDKSFDSTRQQALFLSFQAVSDFVKKRGRLPTSQDDVNEFESEVVRRAKASANINANCKHATIASEGFREHCQRFATGSAAKFSPIQCVFAAIGAQEALKAASGLYFPTHQYLMYDTDEVIPVDRQCTAERQVDRSTQAPGLRHILGDAVVDLLQSKRVFVVGAGAIGCELLKNLASMGIATRKKGKVYLTDMDTIEKSNLSRQLLFRDSDIGRFKSSAAHDAAMRFNPRLRIESHSSKVGDSAQSPFTPHFWFKKIDVVLNALDNVDARLFMDQQCVANRKALVDAGTMGPKGNVQVVVPNQSESYASSVDPPEPAVPVCTLKNFPYMIAHTIQWGRDLFDGLFTRRPSQANEALKALSTSSMESFASSLVSQRGEDAAIQAAEELSEDLAAIEFSGGSSDINASRVAALNWACKMARTLFFDSIVELMKEHPLESLDEDGEPFWTGTRRPPKALKYEMHAESEQAAINHHLVEFVRAAARLRFVSLFPSLADERINVVSIDDAKLALCNPQSATNDSAFRTPVSAIERIKLLLQNSKTHSSVQKYFPIEFEKDDESNGHVAFVNAASNLRAIAYGIPTVDEMETRRVAGNIVPAVSTIQCLVPSFCSFNLPNFPFIDDHNNRLCVSAIMC